MKWIRQANIYLLNLGDKCRPKLLISDTFEPRREAIIKQCNEVEIVYQGDEYTDEDYEGLRCLRQVIVGLLQHEPDKRISIREALSYIDWADHRAEMEEEEMEEGDTDTDKADTEEVKTREADIEKAETEKAKTEEAKVEKTETEKAEVEKAGSLGE